jgi:hypothetical protein
MILFWPFRTATPMKMEANSDAFLETIARRFPANACRDPTRASG